MATISLKLAILGQNSFFIMKSSKNKRISALFEDDTILSEFLSDIRAPRTVFDSHRPIILLFNYSLPLIGCSQRTNQNIDCKWTSSQRPVFGHTFWSLFSRLLKIDDVITSMTLYDVTDLYLFIYFRKNEKMAQQENNREFLITHTQWDQAQVNFSWLIFMTSCQGSLKQSTVICRTARV